MWGPWRRTALSTRHLAPRRHSARGVPWHSQRHDAPGLLFDSALAALRHAVAASPAPELIVEARSHGAMVGQASLVVVEVGGFGSLGFLVGLA